MNYPLTQTDAACDVQQKMNVTRAYKMCAHALPRDKGYLIEHKDACACLTRRQRVSYRAYKMRAHALPRDKGYLIEHARCALVHYPETNGIL